MMPKIRMQCFKMTENKEVGSLRVTVRVVFSFQGTDPDFQLETSAFPKIFMTILE